MKTVILAVLMILSATITHAQDNYSLTKEGIVIFAKVPSHVKLMSEQPLVVQLSGLWRNPAT